MTARFALISLALTMLAGCSQQGAEQQKSLVGSYEPPSPALLNHETLQINVTRFDGDNDVDETLIVEIRPDNSVSVSRVRRYPIQQQKKEETEALRRFRLTSGVAREVRARLARLRPQHLTADMAGSLPDGCQYICDGSDELSVAYLGENLHAGVFELQHGCTSPNVPVIRQLMRDVLQRMHISPESYGFSIGG